MLSPRNLSTTLYHPALLHDERGITAYLRIPRPTGLSTSRLAARPTPTEPSSQLAALSGQQSPILRQLPRPSITRTIPPSPMSPSAVSPSPRRNPSKQSTTSLDPAGSCPLYRRHMARKSSRRCLQRHHPRSSPARSSAAPRRARRRNGGRRSSSVSGPARSWRKWSRWRRAGWMGDGGGPGDIPSLGNRRLSVTPAIRAMRISTGAETVPRSPHANSARSRRPLGLS